MQNVIQGIEASGITGLQTLFAIVTVAVGISKSFARFATFMLFLLYIEQNDNLILFPKGDAAFVHKFTHCSTKIIDQTAATSIATIRNTLLLYSKTHVQFASSTSNGTIQDDIPMSNLSRLNACPLN